MSIPVKALLLTQNIEQSSGVEFQERPVVLSKGGLLVGKSDDTGEPIILPIGGTPGHVLKVKNASEIEWAAEEDQHDQNTDSGTSSPTFYIGHASDVDKRLSLRRDLAEESPNNVTRLSVCKDHTTTPTVLIPVSGADPVLDTDFVTKGYASQLFAANDAMVFVGTVNANGVIQAGYNDKIITQSITPGTTTVQQLTAYSAGWVFKFMENGTGNPLGTGAIAIEKGDMLIASKDRGASFDADDWTIIQSNIDGADIVFKSDYATAQSTLVAQGTGGTLVNVDAENNGVLRRSGSGNLEFGTLVTGNIGDNQVTLGKIQKLTKSRLLGSAASETADPMDVIQISLGDGLSISEAGVLSATKAGTVTDVTGTAPILSSGGATPVISLQSGTSTTTGVTFDKIRHISPLQVLGRATEEAGSVEALSMGVLAGMLNTGTPPSNFDSPGVEGTIRIDENFVYFCVKTNNTGSPNTHKNWRRMPIALWGAMGGGG